MKKNKTKLDYWLIILAPILVILLWQIACNQNWINGVLLPSPKRVVTAFQSLWRSGKYQQHFAASLQRVALGFACGVSLGLIFGFFIGLSRKLDDFFSVIFSILRSIPAIGMIPLLILWFGIGEKTKIIVIALGSFWSVLLNTEHGISGTDKKLLEVASLLEKKKPTVIAKIVLPSALPAIFTGVRLALSGAWRSVVAAEMIASMKGIGYLISYAREMSAPDIMFVGLLTLGLLGLLLDTLLLQLEKRLIRWN